MVEEQFKSYYCLELVSKQRFILMNRVDFMLSASSDETMLRYLHIIIDIPKQKSLAARTEGSKALTFGKYVDQNIFFASKIGAVV